VTATVHYLRFVLHQATCPRPWFEEYGESTSPSHATESSPRRGGGLKVKAEPRLGKRDLEHRVRVLLCRPQARLFQ